MSNVDTYSLPNKLRLIGGQLVCADGSDVREYLLEFSRLAKIDNDTPVVLMRRDGHEAYRKDAWIIRYWAS